MRGLVLPRGRPRARAAPPRAAWMVSVADRGLQLEDQPGADRLDDRGRAALLAVLRVVVVAVLDRVDVHHRAAAGHDRHPVGHQLAADHQHAGRAGPADELVRREEDRVLVRRRVDARRARTSRCRRTARTRRSPRTTRPRGRAAATRCRRCRRRSRSRCWRPRTSRSSAGRSAYFSSSARSSVLVDVAVGVLADGHHVGDRLAPRQLVGVVLEGSDEDDRAAPPAGSCR